MILYIFLENFLNNYNLIYLKYVNIVKLSKTRKLLPKFLSQKFQEYFARRRIHANPK